MTRRFDAEAHRAEIKAMIAAGANGQDIADRFGFSRVTVWKALKRLGLKCHNRAGDLLAEMNRSPEGRARQSMNQWRRWNDPWLLTLSGDLRDARRKMRLCNIPEPEIRRQIDALRARECAR